MNQLALITGASSGIGKATAIELAKKNLEVIIVCKDKQKGKRALDEIIHKSQNHNIKLLIADLSSQNSIHSLTSTISDNYQCVDILIHCAGTLEPKRVLTVDKLEATFAINHIAPFLLTLNLLDLLKSSPQARIITITLRAEELGRIDFNNLQEKKNIAHLEAIANPN